MRKCERAKLNENKYGKIGKNSQTSHCTATNGPIQPKVHNNLSFYRYLAAFKHVFRILILGGSETLIGHLCPTPYYSTNPVNTSVSTSYEGFVFLASIVAYRLNEAAGLSAN